jgi:hypothetical protein
MLNKIYKISFVSALITSPLFASAQEPLGKTWDLLDNAGSIIRNILIPLVFSLALLFFFWGVVKYIKSEGQGKEDGRKIMIWGVVALFVMASVWGIIRYVFSEILGNAETSTMEVPTITIQP